MRILAVLCCSITIGVAACKKDEEKSSSGGTDDTGGEVVVGVCQMPESAVGWYCVEYGGTSWSGPAAEADCNSNFSGSEWLVDTVCVEGAVGTCEIDPSPGYELVVHMFGMDADVAEADCEELLGGDWSD